eukprot:18544-Amphidinium_carterae.1
MHYLGRIIRTPAARPGHVAKLSLRSPQSRFSAVESDTRKSVYRGPFRVLAFVLAIILGVFKAVSVLCRGKRHKEKRF